MKIVQPKPFTFEAGPRAVLLLHGFTGHSADVRMLGRFLEKKGYTSYAPIYRGHGLPPEELLKSSPDDWWKDALAALEHLRELGYREIAVAGLSIGGVLGLKLAYSEQIKGIITMATPMLFEDENSETLINGFRAFSKEYKQLEGKDEEAIEAELDLITKGSPRLIEQIGEIIKDVSKNIDMIYTPTMVAEAGKDQMIHPDSANYIYKHVETCNKTFHKYEKSGHALTFGPDKDQLHEDIYTFLESLDWEE